MVLDEKAKQIRVVDAETGRPKGSIGKGGRLPATEIVVPVDASPAGEATLVLQYTNYHHVHIYSDKGALVRSFPQKTDPKLSSVMSIAGDAQGRIFVAQREKPVRVYDAEGAVLGEGKARLRQAADAEGSSDGTVLLLDNQSNALYATLWEDGALLELAVDLKDRVRNPLDIACDRYGGVYVLASDNRLTRLSPAW
jgi:hypothetical protein